jgi:hypothetical protein
VRIFFSFADLTCTLFLSIEICHVHLGKNKRGGRKKVGRKKVDEKKKAEQEWLLTFSSFYTTFYKKSKEEGRGDSVATKGT